jgi:hypothetical protein
MSCRKAWNREFLDSIMTKAFVDGAYKKYREDLLFQREKSMLPETIPYVERAVISKKYTEEAHDLRIKRRELHIEKNKIPFIVYTQPVEEIIEFKTKLSEYDTKISAIDIQVKLCVFKRDLILGRANNAPTEAKQFIRACPADNCRGFLSSQWKCGICNIWVCPDCHEIKGDTRDVDHTCKPENIETAKLLAKDSKPCPKCASMIFKLSGCDQIFCTACHIAFSWNTGRIETGVIHNPHYYEYLRQTGGGAIPREIGDIPCGGMPSNTIVMAKLNEIQYNHLIGGFRPDQIIRLYRHIEMVELPMHRINRINDNRDLRISYLMKEIDESSFKRLLQQREKAQSKKGEVLLVFQMFIQLCSDIMQRLVATIKKIDEIEKYNKEFIALRDYANENITNIAKRYKTIPRLIKDNWNMYG